MSPVNYFVPHMINTKSVNGLRHNFTLQGYVRTPCYCWGYHINVFDKPVGRSSFKSSTRNWFTLELTCSTSLCCSRDHASTASDRSDNWRSCTTVISRNVLPWQSSACCTSLTCCLMSSPQTYTQ